MKTAVILLATVFVTHTLICIRLSLRQPANNRWPFIKRSFLWGLPWHVGLQIGVVAVLLALSVLFIPADTTFTALKNFEKTTFIVLLALLLIYLLVWRLPHWYLDGQYKAVGVQETAEKDRLDLEIKFRDVMIKAIGIVLTLATLYGGWLQYKGKLMADQYAKAVELISASEKEKRISGLYLLGQLAEESPSDYHWKMMEHTVALIKRQAIHDKDTNVKIQEYISNAPTLPELGDFRRARSDVQAGLLVLGRRNVVNDDEHMTVYWKSFLRDDPRGDTGLKPWLDFTGCSFSYLDMRRLDLSGAILAGAHLEGANLWAVNLDKADLGNAHLEAADLRRARMNASDLVGAHLQQANLRHANLNGADLRNASLSNADLWGAHLERANLQKADCTSAYFRTAHLTASDLTGANFSNALLYWARISWDQLSSAGNLNNCILPDYLFDDPDVYTQARERGVCLYQKQHPIHADQEYRAPSSLFTPGETPSTSASKEVLD